MLTMMMMSFMFECSLALLFLHSSFHFIPSSSPLPTYRAPFASFYRIHNYAYKSAHLITWICDKKNIRVSKHKNFPFHPRHCPLTPQHCRMCIEWNMINFSHGKWTILNSFVRPLQALFLPTLPHSVLFYPLSLSLLFVSVTLLLVWWLTSLLTRKKNFIIALMNIILRHFWWFNDTLSLVWRAGERRKFSLNNLIKRCCWAIFCALHRSSALVSTELYEDIRQFSVFIIVARFVWAPSVGGNFLMWVGRRWNFLDEKNLLIDSGWEFSMLRWAPCYAPQHWLMRKYDESQQKK